MESLSYFYIADAFEEENNFLKEERTFDLIALLHLQGKTLAKLCLAIALVSMLFEDPALALLKQGDRSPEVRQLQEQLQGMGYFNGPLTGYYGPITREAVIRFQQAQGLSPDGVVGSRTQGAIAGNIPEIDTSSFTTSAFTTSALGGGVLKFGQRGDRVKKIQLTLRERGYFAGPATGYYGDLTKSAVMRFQRDRGLKVDGIVGSQTRAALGGSFESFAENSSSNNNSSQWGLQPFISEEQEIVTPFISESDSQPISEPVEKRSQKMTLQKTIYGQIAPKSIVHSGQGLFFAQNMMYAHTITVYDRGYNLVTTIADSVELEKYGHSQYQGIYRGSPVEASFSHNGRYAWVSNYKMYGAGFDNPGDDRCSPQQNTDESFLYRIDTRTFEIDRAIKVGSVPKYVATTPGDRYVLASNWCSYDLSIVDSERGQEIQRVKLGAYPRGIAVDATGTWAYVAVMGSFDIAKVNLQNFSVSWLKNVGNAPRNLNLDPNGNYLYASLNGEQKVAKIDLQTGRVAAKVSTGKAPRSTVLSSNGEFLYVVNYHSDTVSKIRTRDFQVVDTAQTHDKPIGITYDPQSDRVWVSCYSGSILIFSG